MQYYTLVLLVFTLIENTIGLKTAYEQLLLITLNLIFLFLSYTLYIDLYFHHNVNVRYRLMQYFYFIHFSLQTLTEGVVLQPSPLLYQL